MGSAGRVEGRVIPVDDLLIEVPGLQQEFSLVGRPGQGLHIG